MQKTSLLAWAGGRVQGNTLLVESVRTERGFLQIPIAGETIPDGDCLVAGIIQSDGGIPVLLPLGYTVGVSGSFLRLAGESSSGRVFGLETGLREGSFHSAVLRWTEKKLLFADSFFPSIPQADTKPVVGGGSVGTVSIAEVPQPSAQKEKTEVASPLEIVLSPLNPEPADTLLPVDPSELVWKPKGLPLHSAEEVDALVLESRAGLPVEWRKTTAACPPLDGDASQLHVQVWEQDKKAIGEAPGSLAASVPTLRQGRRAEGSQAREILPHAPVKLPAAEAPQKTKGMRNLDGVSF